MLGGGFDEAPVQVSPTLRAGGNATGGDRPPGTDVDTADSLIVSHEVEAAPLLRCLECGEGPFLDLHGRDIGGLAPYECPRCGEEEKLEFVEPQCVTEPVTHCLKAEGFDASEDGTGRGQPIVPVAYRTSGNNGAWETGDRVDALTTGTDPFSHLIGFQGRGSNVAVDNHISGTLTGNSDRASGGAPCVASTAKDYGQDASDDLSPTLRSGGHSDSHANGGVMPAVAYSVRTAQTGANGIGVDEHLAPTLDVSGPSAVAYAIQERAVCENPNAGPDGMGVRGDGTAYTLEARTVPQAVCHEVTPFDTTQLPSPDNYSNPQPGDPCHPLAAGGHAPAIISSRSNGGGTVDGWFTAPNMAVRRLMPPECERLQGFPDNWTRIPVRFYPAKKVTALRPDDMWEPDPNGGWWLMAADGPRYKQCGNSMATHVMLWVGARIQWWLNLEPFRALIG